MTASTEIRRPAWTSSKRRAAERHARLGLLADVQAGRQATDPVVAADRGTSVADWRAALDSIRDPKRNGARGGKR